MVRTFPLISLLSLLVTGFVGCGSVTKPMEPLMQMVGSHKFSGFSIVEDKRENILGKTTQVMTPDETVLIHFEQSQVFAEEAFGAIAYDAEAAQYVLTWESSRQSGRKLTARGEFDDKGRLVFKGKMPTMIYDDKKKGTMTERDCEYVLSFPEPDRFLLTVRFPMERNASYTNFRMLAIRKDGAPDVAEFQKLYEERKTEALQKK